MVRYFTLVVCVLALAGCGSSDGGDSAAEAPRGSADQLLDGGVPVYRAKLRELRGRPVVVNKWASWCPPCRAEFPYFRNQARKLSGKVAFLGVDSNDNDGDARRFLRELPVGYPSFKDPDAEIAAAFGGAGAFPTTAFYDRKGKVAFVHQGGYASERKLAQDIERYAR
jgi:thiol-disulfide isomerase/thioredoxin